MENEKKDPPKTWVAVIAFPVAAVVLVATVMLLAIGHQNYSKEPFETMESAESDEEKQRRIDEDLKRDQRYAERKITAKAFEDAYNYYIGSNGVIQNYRKAEELFSIAAKRGDAFAPHFLVEILVEKYNKLKESERATDHIKECYFWLLIDITHSRLDEGRYITDHTYNLKSEFEKRLGDGGVQKIQDEAGSWWETNIRR